MGILDRLKAAFGGGPGGSDQGIYLYVRCERCGDLVRIRINPAADLQQEFDEGRDGVRGYAVRKSVVDQRCFRPFAVRLEFDAGRRETLREIDGGAFVTREEYEAARPSSQPG